MENFKRNPSDAKVFATYGITVIYQFTERGGKVASYELDFSKDPELAWAKEK